MALTAGRDERDKTDEWFHDERADQSTVINPQPGFHYAPKNVKRIDYWKRLGYEIVQWSDKARLLGAKKSAEGGQENGDLILMRCPVEVKNKRIKKGRDLQRWHEGSFREAAGEDIRRIARDQAGIRNTKKLVIDESHEGEDSERDDARGL